MSKEKHNAMSDKGHKKNQSLTGKLSTVEAFCCAASLPCLKSDTVSVHNFLVYEARPHCKKPLLAVFNLFIIISLIVIFIIVA